MDSGERKKRTHSIVVVGSQAGQPGFVAEIEAREGKGAADDERGYISSMEGVREWALKQQQSLEAAQDDAEHTMQLVLTEPGLVDTPLARREFARFGVDWSTVQTPDALATEVLNKVGA